MKLGRMFQWLLLVLASAPLLLFAYLGSHSRMIHDDYDVAAVGQQNGAWDGLVEFYNRWSGAYSSFFLKFFLADYAVVMPSALALAVIAIGLLGLYWLLSQVFGRLHLRGPRRLYALAASGLALAAAINAYYTPESFYWYSASMRYSLSLVCLIVCLALAAWTVDKWSHSRQRLLWGASACALISFLTAGASEMFLVFQATFLTLLAALALSVVGGQQRRGLAIVAGAMLFATVIGLIIQVSSPGIWNRMELDAANYRPPIRSLSQLATITARISFESVGRQEVIAGFSLLFALGITLGMQIRTPPGGPAPGSADNRISRAAWTGLALQLLFLPILWAHLSDNPRFFGRYSPSYMIVLAINAALLLAFLLTLWKRRRLATALEDRMRGLTKAAAMLLLAFIVLVTLTQVRSIDARASTYLFATALGMLFMLAILWRPELPDDATRALERASLGTLVIAWLTIAALIFVTFIGHGFTSLRIMTGSALLQVFAGMFCGLYAGRLLKRLDLAQARLIGAGGFLTALVIGGGIFLGQARLVPDFQTYGHEWDARHEAILAQRDSGLRHIEAAPLSFDLADYIGMGTLRFAEQFYGVESIEIVDA